MTKKVNKQPLSGAAPKVPVAQPAAEAAPASEERTRQSAAPVCPYCKDPATGEPNSICKSQGSDFFSTRYKCPTPGCPYRISLPRKRMAERVRHVRDSENEGVSARPKN